MKICDPMSLDNIVEAVEQTLLCRKLSQSEQQILLQSFQGESYDVIAQDIGYVRGYLKVVGSRLWRELSTALGQKVTKKNIRSTLTEYLQAQTNLPLQDFQSEFQQLNTSVKPVGPIQNVLLEGPIPLNSNFYIERPPIEMQAYQEINRPGCLLRLKAPRKYGKSSLLLRLMAHATNLGFKPVMLDFQDVDHSSLGSLELLLRWLCANIVQQLQLSTSLDEVWDSNLGSKMSCKAFLQEQILPSVSTPVLLVLNEVNLLLEHPAVAHDFLPMIRSCYEQARHSDLWGKLRWVMAYSTEIYVPLQLNQSPFNVGISLTLPPFNLGQTRDLAQKYGLQEFTSEQFLQLMAMLGGKPYLLNLAFYDLSIQRIPFNQFLNAAPTLTGIFRMHLQHYLVLLLDQPNLMTALEKVLCSESSVQLDPIAAYKLASTGLVTLEGYQARISCHLYRDYLKQFLYPDLVSA